MLFDFAFFVYGLFSLLGFIAFFLYKPKRSKEKAKNVEFVIPTVANEKTINSLFEVLYTIKVNHFVVIDKN